MFRRLLTSLWIALVLAASAAGPVSAHGGEPEGNLWARWPFDPLQLVLIGGAALLYYRGSAAIRRRTGALTGRRRLQNLAFWSGLGITAVALLSPLDTLAADLFSAHMTQHSLLMLAAAPLLVLAMPLPPMLLGLPRRWSLGLGRTWNRSRWLQSAWNELTRPAAAWILFAVILWVWHAPGLYQAAVDNTLIHALQHTSFLLAALLFWWVAIRTLGMDPERRGLGILYLFTTALHSGLLGALITFSTAPWYPIYQPRAPGWGLSPLADQQLAGTIMWVPAGFVFLLAALLMMKAWLDGLEPGEETASGETGPNLP